MTGRVMFGLVVFLFKAIVWVALAHLAVDIAAMLNDRPFDDPDVTDGRFAAGFFTAAIYGFLNGRIERG